MSLILMICNNYVTRTSQMNFYDLVLRTWKETRKHLVTCIFLTTQCSSL